MQHQKQAAWPNCSAIVTGTSQGWPEMTLEGNLPGRRFSAVPFLPLWLRVAFALLFLTPMILAQVAPPERDEAIGRARTEALAKRYDEALAIFGELVRRNPLDWEARNWMGRLESWKGDYREAEQIYRSVLREASGNVEAELGLADVLVWQGNDSDALELLARVREAEPSNTEALLRLGKLYRRQNQWSRALGFYREVLAIQPDNAEARQSVEILLVEQKRFRLESGYLRENFNFASDTNGQFLDLLYRHNDRLALQGRFEYQNKFAENDTRLTLGAIYRFRGRTWLVARLSQAPRSNTVIASQGYTAELTQGVLPGLALGGGYTFLQFREAKVDVWSAIVNWEPRPRLHLYLRYTPSHTQFRLASGKVWDQSGWIRLVWDAHRRFSPYFLAAVGNESFSSLSIDKLGRLAAHSYGGGAELRLTRTQGIRFGYRLEMRNQDRREGVIEVSHFFGF